MSDLITIKNVSKKIPDSNEWMFKNIDLSMPEGKIVFITDQSGSGKSSLLRIIGKLDVPDSGYIEAKTQYETIEKYRQKISLLNQSPMFWGQTVRHHFNQILKFNVNTSKKVDEIAIADLLNIFNFDMSILEMSPFELSGGEAKIIALIRAVLLLDEPENALDEIRRSLFIEFILGWVCNSGKRRSVAWITHQNYKISNSLKYNLTSGRIH